ncbi:uncharacterized protein LOC121053220 isoform X4 [Oryza brachyantha]|uniref:uncharacterized protein LOC121053220 isoform X4 n=1 Tax=Oryza brachyantha TaxID=4533 RepID=UPI001ADC617B|nr:uncharacterized protein LOC121053220 isoform X4 [Oryza brachyantha]
MWELAEVPGSNDLGWTFLVAVKREPLSGFHSAALPDKLHITYEYLQWQSFAIKNQTTVMFFIMGILLHQMNGPSLLASRKILQLRFIVLQTLDDGDMALMDMGGEYNYYGSDITCSYPTLDDGDMALMDMGGEYNYYGSDITCSYPILLQVRTVWMRSLM